MSRQPKQPVLGADSFSCPHCGALAHQHWFRTILRPSGKDDRPSIFTRDMAIELSETLRSEDEDEDESLGNSTRAFLARFAKNKVTYWVTRCGSSQHWELVNCAVSQCHSCDAFSFWVGGEIVFPSNHSAILPHDDMPPEVRADFIEAAEIVDKSARGAAALLRLAIQKMLAHLGEDTTNLNSAIASLVKKGLDSTVQQALDIVRVIGNNAVHPGELDLKDDKATAMQLFALVNIIVQTTISAKAQIAALYASLPQGAIQAIERRDK